MSSVCCLVFVVRCAVFVVDRCPLSAGCCLLFAVRCWLFVVYALGVGSVVLFVYQLFCVCWY